MKDIDENSSQREMYQFLEDNYHNILQDIEAMGYMDFTSPQLLALTETLLKLAKINLVKGDY